MLTIHKIHYLLFTTAVLVVVLAGNCRSSGFTPKFLQFRNLAKDVLKNDYEKSDTYLNRWLTATESNVEEANEMLRKTKEWRKENRIDDILNEKILTFSVEPYSVDSVDNRGRPVLVMVSSRMDPRKIILAGKKEKLIRYYDQMLERVEVKIQEAARTTGKNITQAIVIYDFSGYNLRQHGCFECLSSYIEIMRHYEKNYPGLLKSLVFLNLPKIGVPILEALRPVMSSSTRKALRVFGPNKAEFSEFLLKYIPADQLPHSLGGTKRGY